MDPNYRDVIPWEPRGYRRKRPHDSLPSADPIKESRESHMPSRTRNEGSTAGSVGFHSMGKEGVHSHGNKGSPDRHMIAYVREPVPSKIVGEQNVLNLDYSSSESSSSSDDGDLRTRDKVQRLG